MKNPVYRLLLFPLFLCLVNFHVSSQDARSLYQQGLVAQNQANYYEAIDLYNRALEINPAYYLPLKGLAETYYILEEFDEALAFTSEAGRLAPSSTDIMNLNARILIALGQLQDASGIYQAVLTTEPNNIDALIGIAELTLADGKPTTASSQYLSTLNIHPTNRRALLSLSLIYDHLGEKEKAHRYLLEAIQFHSNNAQVHFLAGNYYLEHREADKAIQHAKTALQLRPGYEDALIVLAKAYMQLKSYGEVIDTIELLLEINRNHSLAWYILALAQYNLREFDKSLNSFQTAFTIKSDDEIARFGLEQILLDQYPVENELRRQFAAYHFEKARLLKDRYYYSRAYQEYRRGLTLYPYDRDANLEFAVLQKENGLEYKYLEKLKFLVEIGHNDSDIKDRIEVTENALEENIAADWNIDQFSLLQPQTNLCLFISNESSSQYHPESSQFILRFLERTLRGFEHIRPLVPRDNEISKSNAFRTARELESDYYILCSFYEDERIFTAQADIYNSDTGILLERINVRKSGNDKVHSSITRIGEKISSVLPMQGQILMRKLNSAIINIGMAHGVTTDAELLILRPDTIQKKNDAPGYDFDPNAVLGTLTITRAEDLIAEGIISINGFFDTVNVGDIVLFKLEENASPDEASGQSFTSLFEKVMKIM